MPIEIGDYYRQYALPFLRKEAMAIKKEYMRSKSVAYKKFGYEKGQIIKEWENWISKYNASIMTFSNLSKMAKEEVIELLLDHEHDWEAMPPPPPPKKGKAPVPPPPPKSTTSSSSSRSSSKKPPPPPFADTKIPEKKRGRPSTKAPPPPSRSSSSSSSRSYEEFDLSSGPGPILGSSMRTSTSKKSNKVKVGRKKRSVISLPAITEIAKVRGRPRKTVL